MTFIGQISQILARVRRLHVLWFHPFEMAHEFFDPVKIRLLRVIGKMAGPRGFWPTSTFMNGPTMNRQCRRLPREDEHLKK